jgi:hypothetical protein
VSADICRVGSVSMCAGQHGRRGKIERPRRFLHRIRSAAALGRVEASFLIVERTIALALAGATSGKSRPREVPPRREPPPGAAAPFRKWTLGAMLIEHGLADAFEWHDAWFQYPIRKKGRHRPRLVALSSAMTHGPAPVSLCCGRHAHMRQSFRAAAFTRAPSLPRQFVNHRTLAYRCG